MPKRTNELKQRYVLLPHETDPRVYELLTEIHHLMQNSRFKVVSLPLSEMRTLESQVRLSISSEDVEANRWLQPAVEFLQRRPLQSPFWFANYDKSSWTSGYRSPIALRCEIADESQVAAIESAVDEDVPWKDEDVVPWTPYNLYLFGNSLWALNSKDKTADEEQLRLLFLEAVDTERRKFERLKRKFSGQAGQRISRREPIPESVRIFVWRRDQGKCVRCGSQERLEFDHIIPVSKGGNNTARNIQLLCETCNRQKSNKI